jgi:PTS system mannose-specific IIC component
MLAMVVRTLSIIVVHAMDVAAEKGNIRAMDLWQWIGVAIQGLRIVVPAAAILLLDAGVVQDFLQGMPSWLTNGMAIGGGMVVAVGYAFVINMMATKEVWPFFIIGFVVAALSEITLIGLGAVGVALALIYLTLSKSGGNGGGTNHGDPLGDILNDY